MRIPHRFLVGLVLVLGVLDVTGCEKKLEKEQCALVRKKAFDLLAVAQPCATDQDCGPTTWPECTKPANKKTLDAIGPIQKEFADGKCEEPKKDCKSPEVYCKQGLCVVREKGMTGTDEIQIN